MRSATIIKKPEVYYNAGHLQPKQLAFCRARHRFTAFGGARGGGKSHVVRKKAITLALEHAGIRILIVRRTLLLLKQNHIDYMRAELVGIAKYNQQDKEFSFSNGSKIFFGYCDNDNDAERYQGPEYDVIFLDEASNLREEWIKKIIACNRGVKGFPVRCYFTMNPGGESHAYLKRLFIDRRYEGDENPDDYMFIQSLVTDNTALMEMQPEYVSYLKTLPYKLRQAWLYGEWDLFEGQFFEEFIDDPAHYKDRRFTHVIDPFTPERNWTYYRSFDWGRARPFSCAWWAIDYEGIAYRLLELYGIGNEPNEGCKWDPDRVFKEIAAIERNHPWLKGREIRGVADPSIWAKDTGMSIYDFAVKEGVYFQRADNERIPGWLQCHYRLHFDEDGIPMVYFFSNCKHLIRTMPLMVYDKHRVEDLDSDLEDHAMDDFRYFCMANPIVPSRPVEAKPYIIDPLSDNYSIGRYRRAI